MQIWLDTISLKVITDAVKKGILFGVTTNPTILSKVANVRETLTHLLEIQQGPVAVQVTGQTAEEMVEEGKAIFEFSNRMIVKVPVNAAGLAAIHQLRARAIPILATAIFHPSQLILAATHATSYVTPYFSHLSDTGNAKEILKTMVTILQVNQSPSKILVASLRTLEDLIYCSLIGVDAITIKEELYQKLTEDHYSLEKCSRKFLNDWQQTHQNRSIKDLLEESSTAKAQLLYSSL